MKYLTKKQTALVAKIRAKLESQERNGDIEYAHVQADSLLCELLTGLGFDDIVSSYRKIEKWYA